MGGLYVSSGGGYTNPIATPVADYNFVQNTLYGPALSVTRASTGYIDDLAGNWTSVAAGALRRSDKGVLIEEARTNSLRNNSMQGAAVGVVGSGGAIPTNWFAVNTAGLTITIIGTGTDLGIDYADIKFSGTPSVNNFALLSESASFITAANGQTWTASVYLAQVGGAQTNITAISHRIRTYDATGNSPLEGSSNTDFKASITGSLKRFSETHTLANASSVRVVNQLYLGLTVGQAIDITLRIGWPQLEQGAFPTSPIRTTGVAATRAGDVVTGTLQTALPTAATMVMVGQHIAGSAVNNHYAVALSDGTSNNRISLYRTSANGFINSISTSSGGSVFVTGPSAPAFVRFAMSGAFATDDRALSFNGASALTSVAAQAFPAGMNVIQVGLSGAGTLPWNGYIERFAILPARMTNAELQRLATLATWGG